MKLFLMNLKNYHSFKGIPHIVVEFFCEQIKENTNHPQKILRANMRVQVY
mgnify:CR=1 FL=1